MAHTMQKKRVVGNPGAAAFGSYRRPKKKYTKRTSHTKKRRNVGEILGFTLAGAGNPGRKRGSSMATATKKKYKKHSAARGSGKHHHRKGNPGMKVKHYRRRGNPGTLAGIGPMVTNAVFVIVGALGSKLAAQAVLGANNVGLIGYAGNAAAGGILWFITEKIMKNRAASTGVIAGTIVQIVLRILNDYTPFGAYVAQLGMGDYQMQSFVTPQVLVDPMRNADIQIPSGWGGGGGGTRMLTAAASPATAGRSTSVAQTMTAASGAANGPGMGGLYGGGWGGGLYG